MSNEVWNEIRDNHLKEFEDLYDEMKSRVPLYQYLNKVNNFKSLREVDEQIRGEIYHDSFDREGS